MESPHTNIPEGSNSTASSPPDPSTPPQDIFSSHPDVVQDRDSTYHHQQHSNITPIQHHPSLPPSAQSTPPKQQIQLPSLHSPSSPSFPFDSHHPSSSYHLGAHSSLPMPLLDRPPPLERATPTEADGFWPVQPSGPLTAPAGTLRRASFLDDLYEPQVNSASHQGSTQSTPVSGSPHPQSVGASFQQPHQAREPLVSLPRINRLSSFNPEWPPNSSASPAFSSSPSPPHISHHAHSNSLPVTSASLSSSPSTTNPFVSPMVSSSSSSYSSYPPPLHSSEPPFLRRASFPIAQREENHSIPPLSSSTSYYNIPPPAQPPQSHRDYSSTIAPPTYPGQQQSQSNYRPVLANSANQGYTAEPMPISASPSVLSHQANVGHGAGPQRHHSYSQQGHNHHHPYASSTSRFMHRSHSTHSIPTVNQDANSWPSRPVHPSAMAAAPAVPAPAPVIMHTDDAASKETAHLRRTCYNCRTTDPPSWRRSTLTPGKIVCNRCGLYERTHLRPRPSGIGGELRKAPSPRVPALTAAPATSPTNQTTFAQSYSQAPPPPLQPPYLQHQYTHQHHHDSVPVKSESPVPMPISTGMLNHGGHHGSGPQYPHHHHADQQLMPQSIGVGVGLGIGLKH